MKSFRQSLKKGVFVVMPSVASKLQVISRRWHNARLERSLGLNRIRDTVLKKYGTCILSGPFKGMRYVLKAAGSTATPKIVGSYESELHPWIEQIIKTEYDTVVDVGCAEGYYAIGLALRLPTAAVWAFDIDRNARNLCRKMASLNGVAERVKVGGACGTASLNAILTKRSLIVSDCEGFEYVLLNPEQVPQLVNADILVELHDDGNRELSDALIGRFHCTHDVSVVSSVARSASDFPALDFLPLEQRGLALSEMRPRDQRWAFLIRRNSLMSGS